MLEQISVVYRCFSFCLPECRFSIYLKQNMIFKSQDKLSPVSNMASSGLKKMLFFVNSNTDGVRVLVCPAIFCTLDGLCGRYLNHQAGVMPVYWLMFANIVFAYGRCHCHAFCGRCYCHCYVFVLADIIAIFCWLMLLP